MAFCFTVGTHDFKGVAAGYENVTAQCYNCGNWSAHVITEWPFFTFCFLPVIPLAFHRYTLVSCNICRFTQDISTRADVQSQHASHGVGPQPLQGPPQGEYLTGPPGYGPGNPGQGQVTGGRQYK